MLTVLCAKSLARLKHRQRALEKTRDSAVLSPDLSTKALSSAPEFWDRQHKAFAYIDSQIQRVRHSARFATGLLAFALVADAGIVLAGIGTANAMQRWQQQHAARKLRRVDPVAEQMMLPLHASAAYGDRSPFAERVLDPVYGPQHRLQHGDAIAQKNALHQLSVLRDDPRIVDILADVALNNVDYSRDVRKLAISLMNKAPDKRTATLNQLLGDTDPAIRAQAYASLSIRPSQLRAYQQSAPGYSQFQSQTAAKPHQVERQIEQQVERQADSIVRHRQSKLAQIDYWRRNQVRQNVPTLITYLSDRDAAVRESSALALADIRDERALIPLHARLSRESDLQVRRALTRALSQMTR
ncbi:MAG: HEAT repeat domain-containing protein [Cyanobacteria bacterium J06639_1]